MVFGPLEGPPCVLYVRAVILVPGTILGMLPKRGFDDFGGYQISWGGPPPQHREVELGS